jgi:hypothetical protein
MKRELFTREDFMSDKPMSAVPACDCPATNDGLSPNSWVAHKLGCSKYKAPAQPEQGDVERAREWLKGQPDVIDVTVQPYIAVLVAAYAAAETAALRSERKELRRLLGLTDIDSYTHNKAENERLRVELTESAYARNSHR